MPDIFFIVSKDFYAQMQMVQNPSHIIFVKIPRNVMGSRCVPTPTTVVIIMRVKSRRTSGAFVKSLLNFMVINMEK